MSRSCHSSFSALFGSDWLSDGVLLWYSSADRRAQADITEHRLNRISTDDAPLLHSASALAPHRSPPGILRWSSLFFF